MFEEGSKFRLPSRPDAWGDAPVPKCLCGSGNEPWPLYDARGIYVSLVCESCEEEVRSRYRPEIFDDSNYECDEQIEPDDE